VFFDLTFRGARVSWGAMSDSVPLGTRTFADGDVIFDRGDPPDCAYLIESGQVRVVARQGAMEVELDKLGRGEFFGEMALVDNEPRSARAVADGAVTCRVITQAELDESLERSDMLTYALIRLLTRRIRKSTLRGE
jgi:CRP-like cAMP-binding protein